MIRSVLIIAIAAIASLETACASSGPQPQWPQEGPPVAGEPGDTLAVLRAIVALSGGPDRIAEARANTQNQHLKKELCDVFEEDCSQPKPQTTWYAVPTPTVRKLAALRGLPLVESATPPLPACPWRPHPSEPNGLVRKPVGYQVRAGLRFESPEAALVAVEIQCDTPAWWPRGDVLYSSDGYRVEYRSGQWRARWQSHAF